jgi:DNA modification methylase
VHDILIKRAERSILGESIPKIKLIEKSSDNVPEIDNESCDFTITSPPYWNIEYYGDEPEQLGNAKTYISFLKLMYSHIEENYRILKVGSFCCYCINDFRSEGIYYAYHADLIRLFLRAGFVLHTIYIIDLGRPLHATFVRQIEQYMLFPKRHEYCLVFRKD